LVDFGSAFSLSRMRSGNPDVYLLREQFESFPASAHKIDSCARIAHHLRQLEQYSEAGSWHEAAGRLTFRSRQYRPELRALMALAEYEKAAECYRLGGDSESESLCTRALTELRRACAPA
jgi:hypothetical protein